MADLKKPKSPAKPMEAPKVKPSAKVKEIISDIESAHRKGKEVRR